MKKTIFLSIFLMACAFLPHVGSGSPAVPDPHGTEPPRRVAIVVSAPLRPYLEALKGLTAALAEHRIHARQPITLPQDTQGDFRPGQAELIQASVDAYVAIGPEALSVVDAVSRATGRPRVFSVVLDPMKLLPEAETAPCGIALTIPAAEQLEAVIRTLPGRTRLGVLYSSAENRLFLQKAEAHARTLGITVQPIAVDGPKKVPERLAESLPHMDALWIIPDPAIDSKALVEYVVETALFQNVPSIGYNRYFLEVGAAMAFVLDYEKIGAATAFLLDLYLRSGQCPTTIPSYDVVVNENVVRRLLDYPKGAAR
ncbi:MAG: ABC transporter substrate binding protein [Desulfosoma sp.]